MNMTACLCGNEFPTHTSAGRVQCYTCSAARNQQTASTRDLVAAMWDVIPRLSCAEIGRRMVPELSKSAVIGIAHRMGLKIRTPANARWGPGKARLPRRLRAHVAFGGALPTGAVTLPMLASAVPVIVAARKAPPTSPQRAPEAPKPPPAPKRRPEAETLLPRAGAPPGRGFCQYATSDSKPYLWCGDPVVANSPYCDAHDRLCRPRRPWIIRDAATESAAV